MTFIPYVLLAILASILSWRWLYIWYLRAIWTEICVAYVVESGEHHTKVLEYIATKPMIYMILEFWETDFRRYILDKDGLNKIVDFFENRGKVAEQ